MQEETKEDDLMTLDEALEELNRLIFNNWERYHYHKQGLVQSDFAAAEQKIRDCQRVSSTEDVYRKTVESRISKVVY
ncbi:MAG: hypothetical protein WAO19_09105 [Candidatus Kryptoniota bacterium]